MDKVLLVDDERYVIESLKATVNWEENGFEVVGECTNGLAALDFILANHPDLVIVDIRMPGMDGLELIRIMSERSDETFFVVVSGYAEFSYVQKALNYGAIGYCLKPFDQAEIIPILKKVHDRIKVRRSYAMLNLIELLSESDPEEWPRFRQNCDNLKFNCADDQELLVAMTLGPGTLPAIPLVERLEIRLGPNRRLYLIKPVSAAGDRRNQFIKPENMLSIGITTAQFSFEGIRAGLGRATLAAYQYFVHPGHSLYDYDAFDLNHAPRLLHQLEIAIGSQDNPGAANALFCLRQAAEHDQLTIQHLLKVFNQLMTYINRKDYESDTTYLDRYEQLTQLFADARSFFAYLNNQLDRNSVVQLPHAPDDIRNENFREILKHVKENFTRDISIQSISTKYSFNANYLSQLFKKTLNMTFTDYLTMLRIAFAKELLHSSSYSISEVAERSGYDDYFYFTRVFKKTTGMTATEYRQKCQPVLQDPDRYKNREQKS